MRRSRVRRLDWRLLVQYLLGTGADDTMKLADIDAARLMNWMVTAAARQEAGVQYNVELHVLAQVNELQAPEVDPLFIEPRQPDAPTAA